MELLEDFGGGLEAVSLAGAGVEFGGDVVEHAGSVKGQVAAPGQVLCRKGLLVFPLPPSCQGEWGSEK